MTHDWILDVLVDLKSFARSNNLPGLAEKLTEVTDLAMIEIASTEEKVRAAHGNDLSIGTNTGRAGISRRA